VNPIFIVINAMERDIMVRDTVLMEVLGTM